MVGNILLLTDGGHAQRKRKDHVEQPEEKPAKRKSVGNNDPPVPGGDADVTTNALQNLKLAKEAAKGQQKTAPGKTAGLEPTTDHPLGDTGTSEEASNSQFTGRAICILLNITEITNKVSFYHQMA